MSQEVPSAASFFVPSLPGLPSLSAHGLSLFAGNLPATIQSLPQPSDQDLAHLFFLLTTNKHIPKRQRLLIFLQGGPGCSSLLGAMLETGPLRVNADGTLRVVQGTAWNEYANVLYLDQPAGTGFSFVNKNDNVRELDAAAGQVIVFLRHFYDIFPEYSTMDTYIMGESYGGQYVPYVASALLKTHLVTPPLKGLLIGNGWVSPSDQYPAYLEYLLQKGLVGKNSREHKALSAAVRKCEVEIARIGATGNGGKGTVLVPVCEEILGVITESTKKDGLCLNFYDTTSYIACGSDWPPSLEHLTPYLRRPDVISALHAPPAKIWQQCSQQVGANFWTPKSLPSYELLPELLQHMPILFYNGDRDLMCAGVGTENMIAKLNWNGAVGFNGSSPQDWTVESELSGEWTTARNLTYVNVFHASHMVPMDVPVASHDMLLRFMQVDTLHAAGSSALVPSRIGNETEAVLAPMHLNGTTLVSPLSPAEIEEENVTIDGFDRDHELQYGPRRTVVLFVMIAFIAVTIWGFVRWSRERRRKLAYKRMKGKGRSGKGNRTLVYDAPITGEEEEEMFEVGDEEEEDEEGEDAHGDIGRGGSPWTEGQR